MTLSKITPYCLFETGFKINDLTWDRNGDKILLACQDGKLHEIGGVSYLTDLTNQVPTAIHAEQYAAIVSTKSIRRRLIAASNEIAQIGFDEKRTIAELVEEAESKLFEVSQSHVKNDIISMEQILADSFERLDSLHKDKGTIRGIPTGYKDLDNFGFELADINLN